MLRLRSLSIKLSVSLLRADKIGFCYLYFSKNSMPLSMPIRKYYMPLSGSCSTFLSEMLSS